MFLATNSIFKTRHTRQARQSTITQMLNKAVRAILLLAFMSGVAACSGVPLIPGISAFSSFYRIIIYLIILRYDGLAISLPCHMIMRMISLDGVHDDG